MKESQTTSGTSQVPPTLRELSKGQTVTTVHRTPVCHMGWTSTEQAIEDQSQEGAKLSL